MTSTTTAAPQTFSELKALHEEAQKDDARKQLYHIGIRPFEVSGDTVTYPAKTVVVQGIDFQTERSRKVNGRPSVSLGGVSRLTPERAIELRRATLSYVMRVQRPGENGLRISIHRVYDQDFILNPATDEPLSPYLYIAPARDRYPGSVPDRSEEIALPEPDEVPAAEADMGFGGRNNKKRPKRS